MRGRFGRITLLMAAAVLPMSVLVSQPAVAADGCGADLTSCPGGSENPSVDGRTVTVTVTSTFKSGGSAGSGGTSTATVKVSPPCYYTRGYSGKEYYKWVESGEAAAAWRHTGGEGPHTPRAGYKDHKDDDKGYWYGSACSSESFGDELDAFFDYADEWFKAHKAVFVEENQSPPVPPIPATLLLEAAQEAMTLPEPVFDWNPRSGAGGATLVNLDTWLWLKDQVGSGTITATAGPTSVSVDATRDKVTFSAPTADTVTCEDAGTPWSAAATNSACTLTFARSRAATPVTAKSSWVLRWSANGEPQGALDSVTATQTSPVDVVEVQTVVTDVD